MSDPVEEASPAVTPLQQIDADEITDDQLIARYLSGDNASFERLYGRYKTSVYGYFKRQLSDAQAQDAFQDTWVRVIDHLTEYVAKGQFSGFVFTVAHNVLMDAHRKQARVLATVDHSEAVEDQKALEAHTPEDELNQTQVHRQFQRELTKLPVHQRSVWILRQETNLSIEQIAKMTDSTREGVKSRLRYANEKLKAGMQKYVRSRS